MEKRTILLVEDDFALAMGTEYALSAEGYEVRHADTIKKAGEMFSDDVSLILLDVMLPDGTGYEFCKTLRGRGVRVPIIFLTAMSEEVNIVQGLELGADDYIAKPFRIRELLARMKAILRRSGKTGKNESIIYRFFLIHERVHFSGYLQLFVGGYNQNFYFTVLRLNFYYFFSMIQRDVFFFIQLYA